MGDFYNSVYLQDALIFQYVTKNKNFFSQMQKYKKKRVKPTFDTLKIVVLTGIEPVTHGFSVRCSTNWATAPSLVLRLQKYTFF